MESSPAESRLQPVHGILLAACAALFVLLRLRWLGHLLMWDEAMNLCAVRAFASGGHDPYSSWFWRYPPLFDTLLLLARPLQAGFMVRAEWVPLLVGLASLFMLFQLNRRVFGVGVALWSALAYGVMPASVYFGLWIKQDALVIFFGLAALLLFVRGRTVWSGLVLGFAFLSKELALFYAIGLALLGLRERRVRDVVVVALLSAVTAGWWYVGFSNSVRTFAGFAAGSASVFSEAWTHPWSYYFTRLVPDLGAAGVVAALVGAVLLLRRGGAARLWPLALVGPAYLVLAAAHGKTPWYAMTLYPAWATLQALALSRAGDWLSRRGGKPLHVAVMAALTLLLALPVLGSSYESYMKEQEEGMWWASRASREAAQVLNGVTRNVDRVMITPMHYYPDEVRAPCPIFVAYLKPMDVLIRPNTIGVSNFVRDIATHKLSWAMISPEPGPGQKALLDPLVRDYHLRPIVLEGACIFRTTSLWTAAESTK